MHWFDAQLYRAARSYVLAQLGGIRPVIQDIEREVRRLPAREQQLFVAAVRYWWEWLKRFA